ncbi:RNA-directed DNA polymerase, eukaryota, reverse transcriptase zinc-binding domain protein [Tanacetum coccineum]
MLDLDLPPPPPVVKPHMKKSTKSLKPLKTTRTMNPELRNTMKHDDIERMMSKEDGNDVSTSKEGLIDPEVSNGMDIDGDNNRSGESTKVKMVSNPSFESNVIDYVSINDCLDKKCGIKPKYTETMSDIPVPVAKNHILNPNFGSNNKPKSPVRVSFWEVKRPGERSMANNISMGDKGSVKNPFSFMSALTGDKVSGNNKLRYVVGSVNGSGREVAKMDPIIEDGSIKWNMTVIGHFVGYRMSYRDIIVTKVPLWVKIYNVPLEAWNVEGISKIASRVGNPIIMDRITTAMCERSYGRASFARVLMEVDSTKGLVDTVEVWYRNLGKSMILDVEYAWRPPVCEHCKIVGHTLKSCSAKDLIEEEKAIKETIKPVTTDEVNTVSNDDWKSVGYRRNGYRRGGFSTNGRGSFGSNRGGYMNNGGRGNGISRQYVPVKNSERSRVNKEEDLRTTKKDQGNNDSMDKMNGDSVVENVSVSGSNSKKVKTDEDLNSNNMFSVLNDEENSEDIVKWREFCSKIDIMCDMGIVAKEEEKVSWTDAMLDYYLDKWKKCNDKVLTPKEVLKGRIDSLQKQIVERNKDVKDNASKAADKKVMNECAGKKVQSTYNSFLKAYDAKLEKIKELKWEKDLLEVDLFVLYKQPLTDSIKAFWSEEMIKYYKGVYEDIRNDRINGHFDDVVGGLNATASFLASDEVSNLHDESMAEMQGAGLGSLILDSRKGCRIIIGWDPFMLRVRLLLQIDQVMHFEVTFLYNQLKLFVSCIYADNAVKDRRTLWKNLINHKILAGDSPWVLLGDFNVLLSFDESSNCYNTRDKGMMDFKECVQDLDIEDINSYRMFYTWIEKRKNPDLGILKKLDRVMGNGNFVSTFERSYVNFLPYLTSDHCPVILAFPKVNNSRPKSFRFLNFLADKDSFIPTVREN